MSTIDTLQIPFMVNPPTIATSRASLNSNPYFQYFGTPQTYQPLTSYEGVDQTLRTFPEALKGRSTFLERTFTLLALTQNAFLTSVILPIKYTNDTHFTWSQWIFHPYLPERVPHLGVVRFVKSQTQTKTKALTRFGLGMALEHGFMETELGRQHYAMEVRQITQAINEGLQAEALYALMNSQSWELDRLRKMNGSGGNTLHTPHVDAIIQRELDTWAYMQQNRYAWFGMNDHVNRAIETYSQGGFNAWIIDIRVDSFRKRVAEDQTTFSIRGPGFMENLQQGAQHYSIDTNGNAIYATRSFLTGERPVNPLESLAQIGEYVLCADVPDTNFDNYDSSNRTQKIYDEDYDVMKDITLRQKLQHCQRFKPDGTLMTFRDLRVKAAIDDAAEREKDFLHYKTPNNELRPLSLFGQLRSEHFDQTDYRDLARTVFAKLAKTSPYGLPVYEEAFATLRRYIEEIGNVPYDNKYEAWVAALAFWNPNLANANTGSNAYPGNVDGLGDIRANSLRSLDMFPQGAARINFGTNQWCALPPTHGTYGGFKTIQQMAVRNNAEYNAIFSRDAALAVDKAITVFDQFVAKIEHFFPKSLAAWPAWVSPNIHNPQVADAIFENLVCRQFPSRALFIRPITAGLTTAINTRNTAAIVADGPAAVAEVVDAIELAWASPAEIDNLQNNTISALAPDNVAAGEFDALFPSIKMAQSVLFKNVTGNLEIRDIGAGARNLIGARIGAGGAADEVNIQNAPESTLSDKAVALSAALGGDLTRLKLRMMTPSTSVSAASTKAMILLMLVYIDTSSWKSGNSATTSAQIAAKFGSVLDRLDRWTIPIADPSTTVAVLNANYAQNGTIDIRIKDYVRKNPNTFISAAQGSISEIFTEIQEIASRLSTSTGEASAGQTFLDKENYRAAPVRIGRAAYINWIQNGRYGLSRMMPGSGRFTGSPLTQQEYQREQALNAASNESTIFDANYAQADRGAGDIKNMMLIVNAKSLHVRGVGQPRDVSFVAPEYSVGARRVVGGMPSIGNDTKRARYDSNIVGGSMTLAAPTTAPDAEFTTDDLDQEIPKYMENTFRDLCRNFDGQLGMQYVSLLFMFTPVTRQALEATINHDLLHPFDYIVARPHATYQTVASIKLKPGAETGNTLIGNIQVTVGDDTTVQVIQAAVRFYQGAIIYEPKNIYVVPNSMVVGYHGGLGTGFIDPSPAKYNPRIGIFGDTRDASIMVLAIPRHEKLVGTALSLSGQLTATEPNGRTSALSSSPSKYSYNTGSFYNGVWGFYLTRWNDFEYSVSGPNNMDIVPNTVVFASMALYRDPKTGAWTCGTSNTGHWHNDTVGPGMHAARIGHKSFPLSSQPLARTIFSF